MKKIKMILSVFLCLCLALSEYAVAYAQEPNARSPVGPSSDVGVNAVIDENQNLWTWGINCNGSLGTGSLDENARIPTKILSDVDSFYFPMTDPSASFMAALRTDGSLWMWGSNDLGQLGLGDIGHVATPTKVMENVESVYLDNRYTAVVKTDGSLWMWGLGQYGVFGSEEIYIQYEPLKVMDNVEKFSTDFLCCAVVKTDGSLWGWGQNSGQFGPDNISYVIAPTKIMDNVVDVTVSASNLAFIKSDHTLWMSGSNDFGQIGNGTTESVTEPIQVMGNVNKVYFGGNFVYAQTMNSSLYSWGGTTLNGTIESITKPEKMMDNIKSFKPSGLGLYAAITNDNDLYMWGTNIDNTVGGDELGDYVNTPVKVLSNVKDVLMGNLSSVAIKTDNTYWTWGKNLLLETGNSDTLTTPTQFHLNYKSQPMFSDVPKNAWFYDAVNYISTKGIMTGMREGYFGATENLSRAQFATLLHRMAGEEKVPYEKKYKDVPQGTFFTDAVMWASSKGIITGYTEGLKKGYFGASDNMTREQMAVMMYRYAKDAGLDTTAKADLSKFPDGKKTSSFAKEAMEWAVGVGLITGNADGTLAPQGNVSRAVCATIIMRFLEA